MTVSEYIHIAEARLLINAMMRDTWQQHTLPFIDNLMFLKRHKQRGLVNEAHTFWVSSDTATTVQWKGFHEVPVLLNHFTV